MTHPQPIPKTQRHSSQSAARARLIEDIPVSERRINAASISTSVLEGGEGPPLVLLHGPGEFAATWKRVIPDLVQSHRVVAPDLPGHGATGLPPNRLDMERTLAWLADVVAQTCTSDPTLAGHLLGGAIALRHAAAGEESIRRLVLVDAYGLDWLRPSPRFAFSMVRYLARPTPKTQEKLFRNCFVDLDAIRGDMGGGWEPLALYALDRAQSPTMKAALRRLMPKFGVPPIPDDDLARISVPTRMIWGRHDAQVSLRIAEKASKKYGWPLEIIEDAADDPAVEQPAAFLKAFRTALRA